MNAAYQGFSTQAEVNLELDRMDALLGDLMLGFDMNKSESEFKALMNECDGLVAEMTALHKLLVHMRALGVQ